MVEGMIRLVLWDAKTRQVSNYAYFRAADISAVIPRSVGIFRNETRGSWVKRVGSEIFIGNHSWIVMEVIDEVMDMIAETTRSLYEET